MKSFEEMTKREQLKHYPYGSYCEVAAHVVVHPGQTRKQVEDLAKKYSSSPQKNWIKVQMH